MVSNVRRRYAQVLDLPAEDAEGERAMLEAEMRVWNLLKELDALSDKTGEGGGKQIDYDMQRCSPDPKVRSVQFDANALDFFTDPRFDPLDCVNSLDCFDPCFH